VSVVGSLALFTLGASIGHIGPRLPTLWMTRARGFNRRFPAHPHPVPLSPYLTQRVLHMRSFYWLSFVLGALVLAFGAASLRWGSAVFGFGLWVASSWMMLSRLQLLIAGRPAPWTKNIALELQSVMNASRTAKPVAVSPIRCGSCRAFMFVIADGVLSRIARPDLGRPRSDGALRVPSPSDHRWLSLGRTTAKRLNREE
jgi:hypothetical protein